MRRKEIQLPLKPVHLKITAAVLICGVVFTASQLPVVRGFFGGITGGASNSFVSNAGLPVRQPTNAGAGSLLAYYPFDGSAQDQVKRTGSANLTATGASGGSVSQAAGKLGSAATFNANQDRLEASSSSTAAYGGNTSSYTFAAWVYLTSSTNNPTVLAKYSGDGSGSREFILSCSDSSCTNLAWVVYNTSNGSTSVSKTFGGLNTWQYVVVDYTVTGATTGTLSIDINNSGSPSTANATLASQAANGSKLMIGNYIATTSGQYYWKGRIDAVGHWNRILSTEEKTALYNGGSGRSYNSLPGGLKTSLQNWWDLDEAGTNTRVDSIKTTPAAPTTNGTPELTTGVFGQAYNFDINDSFSTTSPTFTGTAASFSAWFRLDSNIINTCGTIASRGHGITSLEFAFQHGWNGSGCSNSNLSFYIGGQWHIATGLSISTQTWYHYAATYDGAHVRIYLNGQEVYEQAETDPIPASYSTLWIGRQGDVCNCNYMQGDIDDLRIFNAGLSAEDVATLYGGTAPPNCDQTCTGWWKLDETSGTSATDSSGNNRTGTYSGGYTQNSDGIYSAGVKLGGTDGTVTADSGVTTGTATISFWMNPANISNDRRIISSTSDAFSTRFNNGAFQVWGNNWVTVINSISTNTWTHVVITFDGTPTFNVTGYKNGVKELTADAGSNSPNIGTIRIGGKMGCCSGSYFSGNIDDVRVYNRKLSDQEIYSLYLAGKP